MKSLNEQTVVDVDQLRTYIALENGGIVGSIALSDVWKIDPYENGGNITGTFTIGQTLEDESATYFTSAPGEFPPVKHAVVASDAESFALGALKVQSPHQLTA